MNMPSFAAREAALVGDALDRTLLALDDLPPTSDRQTLVTRVHAVQRALAVVGDPHTEANAHLDHLTHAERELAKLIATLRHPTRGTVGARLAQNLEAFRQGLQDARAPAIDELAAGTRTGAPPDAVPYAPSRGVPQIWAAPDVPTPNVPPSAVEEVFLPPVLDIDQLFAELRRADVDPAERGPAALTAPALADELHESSPALIPLRFPRPTMDIDVRGVAGELAQLRRLARDCVESIGSLGNLRRLDDDDTWSDATMEYERQLLTKLDALFALGAPVAGAERFVSPTHEAVRYAQDTATEDVFRAFVRALVLTCTDSESAARMAVLEMRRSAPHTLEAQADAFSLASGTLVDAALRGACREEARAEHLVACLTALARREGRRAAGSFVAEALPLLQHNDDEVRAAALRCMGASSGPAVSRAWLEPRLDDPAEPVVLVALEILARVDLEAARARLRDALDEDIRAPGILTRRGRAAVMRLLGICGGSEDAERLRAAVTRDAPTIEALGWHGHPSHVAQLIALVAEDATAVAAGRALQRLSGLEMAPGEWPGWWAAHGSSWGEGRRRLGSPFNLQRVVDELSRPDLTVGDRDTLASELTLAGSERHIDVRGWAAAQLADLHAIANSTVSWSGRSRPLLETVPDGRWLAAAKRP